jgi:radical SAM protein with 4Fe4S-binding SPASM domain
MDVGISFHAANAALHDRLSGEEGSFEKAVRAVRYLREYDVRVCVKHSVSNQNFGEYRALRIFAESEGCIIETDPLIMPSDVHTVSRFALSDEQLRQFNADNSIQPLPDTPDSHDWNLHCDAGRSVAGISADGTVYPCVILPLAMGSVIKEDFSSIWHGAAFTAFRETEKQLTGACAGCSSAASCARCPAVAFRETGIFSGDSPSLCARAQAL